MSHIELNSILNLVAYLDPGSGSILIQLIISVLIGVGFFFRSKLGKLKNLFSKTSDEPDEEDHEDDKEIK